mgnify:CR=1 FL=1
MNNVISQINELDEYCQIPDNLLLDLTVAPHLQVNKLNRLHEIFQLYSEKWGTGINETQDQPTTITNYYLYTVDGSDTSYTAPFFINASNNLQIFAEATFESLIQEWIRYTAASSTDGYAISYNLGTSGSGNERGSGMADTKLNSSTYTQRFVNANDYRTQEFPSGTAVTQNTYYLRINKS